eukprot:TCONS_00053087-protein
MVSDKVIKEKCKELGIKFHAKTRISLLKQKLTNHGVDLSTLVEQTSNELNENLIPAIVEEVMKRLNHAESSSTKDISERKSTKNGKKSKNKKRKRSLVVSDGSSSSSSEELSSSDEEEETRTKRKKSKRTFGKSTLSLTYCVAPAVKSKLLQGKYVPLYKLLPGFDSRGQETASVLSEAGGLIQLNVGDGNKERRLGKQKLDLCQMILALLKFKELISEDFPSRARDIDMYLANVVMIANKYGGLAYWYYHLYFWDKAAELSDRGEELNWCALDAEALHAAVANNAPANFCDNCQTWYHHTSKCPFD